MISIAIFGDSFASDWAPAGVPYPGWPNLLQKDYCVTNFASAGSSQYRIWKKVRQTDLKEFDLIIIHHTSPYRIFVDKHPTLYNDPIHHSCDLLLHDIHQQSRRLKNIFNFRLRAAKNWINNFFNEQYYLDTYYLYKKDINRLLADKEVIELDLRSYDLTPGLSNHLDAWSNHIVYTDLVMKIDEKFNTPNEE